MLIGAAQGALIGVIILQKHAALYANRFLALMMFTLSAILVHMVCDDLGLYGTLPLLFPVMLSLSLAVTPLHYLYAKFVTDRTLRFRIADALHFIPFILFLAAGMASLSASSSGANFFFEHRSMEEYPAFFLFFNWAIIVQGLSYVTVVLRRIARYERALRDVYSNIETKRLRWLRNITLLAAAAFSSFLIEQTFLSLHINLSSFMISSILLAVYLFLLGYLGMLKSEVLESASEAVHPEESARYERSGLAGETAELYSTRITDVMERERPYRQSELTLSQLAELAGISPHNCSEVINAHMGKSFYDLVNEYRIRDVKQALSDPAQQRMKILAIAFEAGFNSKASFNTVFKQMTGETPSAFRKKALGASA